MDPLCQALLELLACALNGTAPDAARVRETDLSQLYALAKSQTVRAAVHIALERAGIVDEAFREAYMNALRKNILLEVERTAILHDLDAQGIWYMPLKGAILVSLYPENGMREMADNDILYDQTRQQDVLAIMRAHGYTAERVGRSHHDIYMKPPVYNFEMHTSLIGDLEPAISRYYADPLRLMEPDGTGCGYHFSDEQFYLYMVVHEYKHYSQGGTGIRSLMDRCVYLRAKPGLDWDYLTAQTDRLGITAFEQEGRALAMKIFSPGGCPALTDAERSLLRSYLAYGTYGTRDHQAENDLGRYRSRAAFIRARLFPDLDYMKKHHPFFCKHVLLLPLGYLWRLILGPFVSTKKIAAELRILCGRRRDDHE